MVFTTTTFNRYMVILVRSGDIFQNSQNKWWWSWQITSAHKYFTLFPGHSYTPLPGKFEIRSIRQKEKKWEPKHWPRESDKLNIKYGLVLNTAIYIFIYFIHTGWCWVWTSYLESVPGIQSVIISLWISIENIFFIFYIFLQLWLYSKLA